MDPNQFGQFGFAYSIVAVVAVIWRAGFLARLALVDPHGELLKHLRTTLLLVIGSTPLSVSAILLVVWAAGGRAGLALSTVLMCLSLPMVLVYEGLRQGLIAVDEARWPVSVSAIWLVASGISLLGTWGLDSVLPVLFVWVLGGVIGCTVLWLRMHAVAKRRAYSLRSATGHEVVLPSVGHFNLVAALPALASLGVAWAAFSAAGPSVVAQIVVLNAVLYPLSVYTQAVPLLARKLKQGGKENSGVAALGIIVGAAIWFGVVTWVFPQLVAVLFGQSWILASGLLWIATLNLLVGALVAIETVKLHQRGVARPVRLVVMVFSPVRVGAAWLAAAWTGSAEWIIAAELIVHVLMWFALRLTSRRP